MSKERLGFTVRRTCVTIVAFGEQHSLRRIDSACGIEKDMNTARSFCSSWPQPDLHTVPKPRPPGFPDTGVSMKAAVMPSPILAAVATPGRSPMARTDGRQTRRRRPDFRARPVTIPNSASLSPASQMTVAFWTRQITVAQRRHYRKMELPESSTVVGGTSTGQQPIRVYIAPTVNDPTMPPRWKRRRARGRPAHGIMWRLSSTARSPRTHAWQSISTMPPSAHVSGSSIPASLANAAADITILAVPDTNPWNGDIDEVRIYGRALTSQEIDAIYHDTGAAGPVTPPAPHILSFTASPAGTIPGQPSLLSWTLSVRHFGGRLDNGVGPQSAASTGWSSVSPAATTTYTLTATNANGSVTAQTTVTVTPRTGTLSIRRAGRYPARPLRSLRNSPSHTQAIIRIPGKTS